MFACTTTGGSLARSVTLLATVLACLSAACQPEEQPASGQSWDCNCDDVEVHACAMTAAEASGIAYGCIEAAGLSARYCDCVESPTWFCELGECVIL